MTDKEKLDALITYIRSAERFHLDNTRKGIEGSGFRAMAIQDIQTFMEHKLGIEYVQLDSKVNCLTCKHSFSEDSPDGDTLHCMIANEKIVEDDDFCAKWKGDWLWQ